MGEKFARSLREKNGGRDLRSFSVFRNREFLFGELGKGRIYHQKRRKLRKGINELTVSEGGLLPKKKVGRGEDMYSRNHSSEDRVLGAGKGILLPKKKTQRGRAVVPLKGREKRQAKRGGPGSKSRGRGKFHRKKRAD